MVIKNDSYDTSCKRYLKMIEEIEPHLKNHEIKKINDFIDQICCENSETLAGQINALIREQIEMDESDFKDELEDDDDTPPHLSARRTYGPAHFLKRQDEK